MKLTKRNYIEISIALLLIVGWYFYYKKYFKDPVDTNAKRDDFLMLMPMITTVFVIIYILSNRTPLSQIKL